MVMSAGSSNVNCLAGETPISGGYTATGVGYHPDLRVYGSSMVGSGWTVSSRNMGGSDLAFRAIVYCVKSS